MDKLLSAAEAAERAGLSKSRVKQLCLDRQIPALLVGRQYAIRAADLARFLRKPRRGPGRPRKARAATNIQ